MSKPNDGGPAFPRHYGTAHHHDHVEQLWHGGMTLRDWFSGQALAGLLGDPKRNGTMKEYAEDAYESADVMLKVREQ